MANFLQRATFYSAFGAAVSILFSIALSQSLLGLSLAFLLFSGEKLKFPPIRLPLALFFLITVLSLAASPNPAGGTPQLRKFFIFAVPLVLCSSFQTIAQVRTLILTWSGVGALAAVKGIVQFAEKWRQALEQHADTYGFFLDGRITGFASHWMTFGGEQMIVLLVLFSFLLFAPQRIPRLWGWFAFALMAAAIVLGMTRCIFLLGMPLGLGYLLWQRRRVLVLAAIAVGAIGLLVAPATLRERIVSVVKPHERLDSNAHRSVCRAVGWEMVKAHPWLGVGPEQVGPQFDRYIPASVPRPLPSGWYGHLHNIYFQYAAERGVFGLAAMLWLIGRIALDFLRGIREARSAEARTVLHGGVAVILAVLAEGLFEYNLGDSEVLTLFLGVAACGYVVLWKSGEVSANTEAKPNSAQLTQATYKSFTFSGQSFGGTVIS